MPRLEHLNLSHHALGKEGAWAQKREALQLPDYLGQAIVLSLAGGALFEVSAEGGNTKPLLVIEEQVDLVRE